MKVGQLVRHYGHEGEFVGWDMIDKDGERWRIYEPWPDVLSSQDGWVLGRLYRPKDDTKPSFQIWEWKAACPSFMATLHALRLLAAL